jgi:glycosyltransferase involved in cell wall biosynthesis
MNMPEDYPKISILIPTYNRAHYLMEAIETCLQQDYSNFEVIVSDNASTDDTMERLQKYLDNPHFRYYRNGKNLGASRNYEKLLYEYATGKFGHYLTDDDYFIDPQHLTRAMQIIKKHDVRTVFSGALSRYKDERSGRSLSLGLDEIVSQEWWLENLCRTKGGLTYFPSCGSGTLFEIDKAKELGAFREGIFYADYDFALQCILSHPKIGYIQKPQYVERRHEAQDGRTSYSNAFHGTMIFQRLYEFGCRMNIDPRVMDKIRLRGFQYFTKAFLLPNWIIEKGNSFPSFCKFLKELRKFDRRLPYVALLDPNTLVQFFFYGTATYEILKKMYLQYRSWNYDKKIHP